VKQKQLLPTVTVTVAAPVTVGWKTRSEAIVATINVRPRKQVFIALVFSSVSRRRIANNLLQYAIVEK
jgi:hypothetical protein